MFGSMVNGACLRGLRLLNPQNSGVGRKGHPYPKELGRNFVKRHWKDYDSYEESHGGRAVSVFWECQQTRAGGAVTIYRTILRAARGRLLTIRRNLTLRAGACADRSRY